MNVKKLRFLNFPLGMKKLLIFGLIGIFLLSGCEELKDLYGIQPSAEEEYVPLEEIMVEEEFEEIAELPPELPGERVVEEVEEEVEEILEEEVVEEIPELEEIVEELKEEVEEIPEEELKEEAKVIIVEETELISLKPKATDPDADKLTFTYTTPLNKDGKWQTGYGDAGEYTITVTVSDGQLSATKDVLVIVNKKEEVPVIDEALPEEQTLGATENSKLTFSVKASDLNKDILTYSWKLDDDEVSTETSYVYNMGYDAAGQHTIKLIVSDGVEEASNVWALSVENVNRKPVLEKIAAIMAKETDKVEIIPVASDADSDELSFSVDNADFKMVDGKFEWDTTYDDAGEYTVTLTVSDGEDEISQEVEITIENVNRPPIIEDIVLG